GGNDGPCASPISVQISDLSDVSWGRGMQRDLRRSRRKVIGHRDCFSGGDSSAWSKTVRVDAGIYGWLVQPVLLAADLYLYGRNPDRPLWFDPCARDMRGSRHDDYRFLPARPDDRRWSRGRDHFRILH